MKRKTTKEFIQDAQKIHGKEFKYDLVEYVNAKHKVKIICSNNHIFEQIPNDHLRGHGCQKCRGWGVLKNSNKEFIRRLKFIFGDNLLYHNTKYKDHNSLVQVTCIKHGKFKKRAKDLLIKKSGCPKCGFKKIADKNRRSLEEFIKLANEIHNNKYDYSLVEYKGASKFKVKIICPFHGIFTQYPKDHINQTQGCPKCCSSKGELKIRKYLEKNHINYIPQHSFEDCTNQRKLLFDFFIPKLNMCIEFDGIQHFKPIAKFGGVENLKYIQHNDNIKNEYCKNNNIKLLRIKFNQINKINQILNQHV